MESKSVWKDPFLYIAVLINVAVHHVWFFSTGILTHWDSAFAFTEQMAQVTSFQAWSVTGMGGVPVMPSFYPLSYLNGLLSRAGLSTGVIQRVVAFCPLIIVGSLGSYLLVKKLSGGSLGAMVGSFVFNFNTCLIVHTALQITIAAAIAWFPLALYLFLEMADRPSLGRALVCSLPLIIISFFDFRIFYICCLTLLLLYFFSLPEGRSKRGFLVYTALFSIPVAVTLLSNAYWIAPYYLGGLEKSLQGIVIGRGLFTGGTTGANLLHNALTTFHPIWTGSKLVPFTVHPIPPYWFMVPIIAFLPLFFEDLRNDGKVLFFAALAIIGIFLTKFFFPPFPSAYEWLYNHFPGFNAFREPGKFGFLVYLPYAVLIGCLIGHLQKRTSGRLWKTLGVFLLAAMVSLLFLSNALPVATGSAGTLFVTKDLPSDYEVFKEFIRAQPDFFRTLWVPTYSRWSYFDDQHPAVSCAETIQQLWHDLLPPGREDCFDPETIMSILEQSFSCELLKSASVKYVVVPLQDDQNDDDFFPIYGGSRQFFINRLDSLAYLERLAIGTGELAVYRTQSFYPQLFTPREIASLDPQGEIDAQYALARYLSGDDIPFTMGVTPISTIRIEDILSPFEGMTKMEGIEVKLDSSKLEEGSDVAVIADRGWGELRCIREKNRVVFERLESGRLSMNGQSIPEMGVSEETLRTVPMEMGVICWLEVDGILFELDLGAQINLGELHNISSITLYQQEGPNIIPNGSFEEGLWKPNVEDLGGFYEPSELNMSLDDSDASDGRYSLRLEATKHVAGTQVNFGIWENQDFVLKIDCQSKSNRLGGYSLHFNDQPETVISGRLPHRGGGWDRFQRRITSPPEATVATLYLYSFEGDGVETTVNLYDGCELVPLQPIVTLDVSAYHKRFQRLTLPASGVVDFRFVPDEQSGENLIANGSFEQGLWGSEAIDCNPYDDRPEIGMGLSSESASEGRYSLQLEARRHIAGTYTIMPVEGNREYYLSFDYQSPNARKAGYYLHFNDEKETVISGELTCEGTEWQNFSLLVTSPLDATVATLFVYSMESDGNLRSINRYDNFKFFRVCKLSGRLFLARKMETCLAEPEHIEMATISATRRVAKLTSGHMPVVMVFGQRFDPGWSITPASQGRENSMAMLATPMSAADSREEAVQDPHFMIDGGLNGWYIEPDLVAGTDKDESKRGGTKEVEIIVEFLPQRYVRWASILSLLTLAGLAFFFLGLTLRKGKERFLRARSRGNRAFP